MGHGCSTLSQLEALLNIIHPKSTHIHKHFVTSSSLELIEFQSVLVPYFQYLFIWRQTSLVPILCYSEWGSHNHEDANISVTEDRGLWMWAREVTWEDVSHGSSAFKLWRNPQTNIHNGCVNLHPHQWQTMAPCSPYCLQHVVKFVDESHPDSGHMGSQNSFNLHPPDG